MQVLKFSYKRLLFGLVNERTFARLYNPVPGFHQRAATVITKLFFVLIKISAIAFSNVGRYTIGSINKLGAVGLFRKPFSFINKGPNLFANFNSKLVNLQVFQFHYIHII